MKRILVLGPINDGTVVSQNKMKKYAEIQRKKGNAVYLPGEDANQDARAYDFTVEVLSQIEWSEEVHVFCDPGSKTFIFYLGMVFALKKKIEVIENVLFEKDGKSIPETLSEWQKEQDKPVKQLVLDL